MTDKEKEITWRAAEYEYTPKDTSWYLLIGALGLGLIISALWQKNFIFALFIVLATGTLMLFGNRRPQIMDFTINEKGVGIGKKIFYELDRFENFAIRSRPQHLDEIVLKRKILVNPYLRIPIDSKSVIKAREILQTQLSEVEYEESVIDALSQWLGL